MTIFINLEDEKCDLLSNLKFNLMMWIKIKLCSDLEIPMTESF